MLVVVKSVFCESIRGRRKETVCEQKYSSSSVPASSDADGMMEGESASAIDVDGAYHIGENGTIHALLINALSYGVDSYYYTFSPTYKDGVEYINRRWRIGSYPEHSLRVHPISLHTHDDHDHDGEAPLITQILLACETASPRYNRVHL